MITLQLSFGPIGWLMISEVFPLKLRGRGLSVAVLVNFASNALVTIAFSPLEVQACCSFLLSFSLVLGVYYQVNPFLRLVLSSSHLFLFLNCAVGLDWHRGSLCFVRGDCGGVSRIHILHCA